MAEPSDHRPCADSAPVLSLTTTRIDEALVVTAIGEVDAVTAPTLLTALRGALEACGGVVVVDLSGISFLSSAGLGVLDAAAEIAAGAAESRGSRLRLVADHQRPVLHPLRISGLDHMLALYDTVLDALTAGHLGTVD